MFKNHSQLIVDNPPQLNYGIAILDVDQDGQFEIFVAGFGFRNLILKWNGNAYINIAKPPLSDGQRQSIGIAACDLDADGLEEIYILNTDTFGGIKRTGDRLFDWVDGEWVDLFSVPVNQRLTNLFAGRSVICVDRNGAGQYGFFVANYGGPMRLYELDEDGFLQDVAPDLGINLITGGRSLIALPLVSEQMDIFAGNEMGPNFLFRNRGDGTYEEIAQPLGLSDPGESARGVAVLDANGDGLFDLICGNWEGETRLFIQTALGKFEDAAPVEIAEPARVRNVIVADFDNDGYEEIFFNNIAEPNRLFSVKEWKLLEIGDALEPAGLGTGAAVGDFDQDGRLELIIAHGESGMQPLTLYRTPANGYHWLRVFPLTQYGAPARGAVVTLRSAGRLQRRVIDGGSGYLCQMEPVAHFGLGASTEVEQVEVRWLDGVRVVIENPKVDRLIRVAYPD